MPWAQPVTNKLRFDLRVAFGERIPAQYEAGEDRFVLSFGASA
jgi:hypothetical protein